MPKGTFIWSDAPGRLAERATVLAPAASSATRSSTRPGGAGFPPMTDRGPRRAGPAAAADEVSQNAERLAYAIPLAGGQQVQEQAAHACEDERRHRIRVATRALCDGRKHPVDERQPVRHARLAESCPGAALVMQRARVALEEEPLHPGVPGVGQPLPQALDAIGRAAGLGQPLLHETVLVLPATDQHGPDESLLRAEEVQQH